MADQFGYPAMPQHGQPGAYPSFPYPNASGDQTAQLLSGYGLPQDIQQFAPLVANAFGPQLSSNGDLLEALAQQQGLSGFNPAAFLQDQGGVPRGSGNMHRGGQRGDYNKFGVNRMNSNLPSVTNPDGLREDTVFVSNLPQTVDHETMKSQFGSVGKIKINNKSGMPMIWIFKEKGIPKGDALVTYEDSSCVQDAIKWFSANEFLGRKIEVKQATNSQRPVIIPPGGGGGGGGNGLSHSMGGGSNNSTALTNAAVAFLGQAVVAGGQSSNAAAAALATIAAANNGGGGFGGGMPKHNDSLDGHPFDDDLGGSSMRGGRFMRGGRGSMMAVANGRGHPAGDPRAAGSSQAGSRLGDWGCSDCMNVNFAWRDTCNRCHGLRSDGYPLPSGGGGSRMDEPHHSMGGRGVGPMGGGPPMGFGRGMSSMPGGGAGLMGGGGLVRGGGAMPPARGVGPMRGGMGRARPAPY